MKATYKQIIFTGTFFMLALAACKKDEKPVPVPPTGTNETEIITTLKLTLVDSANSANVVTATFRDPDGEGGVGPDIMDTIKLKPSTTYYASLILLNELAAPDDTISNEVAEEANDHQFFFVYTGVSIVQTYEDADSNVPPLPIGLSTKWKTGVVGNGTSRVVLKHQPGIKDGNMATGETDIDVTFQTKVQL